MTKKQTIVVDLDNVLAQSAEGFMAISNGLFKPAVTPQTYSEDWAQMWGVTHEEAVRRGKILFERHYQATYQPVAGALPVLQALSTRYRLVVLTSRRQVSEAVTREWLEKYYPSLFPELMFSGFWEDPTKGGGHLLTKGEQLKTMGVAYFIDDHLKHCASAAQNGIPSILFGEYPWNRHDALPTRVTRCRDWAAVLEYFDGQR